MTHLDHKKIKDKNGNITGQNKEPFNWKQIRKRALEFRKDDAHNLARQNPQMKLKYPHEWEQAQKGKFEECDKRVTHEFELEQTVRINNLKRNIGFRRLIEVVE